MFTPEKLDYLLRANSFLQKLRSSDSNQHKDMTTSNTPSVEDLNTARKIFVAARRESLLSNKKETYF
ncbi:unnamed protein product [Schistosoma mattheei]|uniref:Uncharacterized protein n=1 Tax=Schistosoma mattheei TaxID=31246 RepID=A0AA85B4B4_9TREM|nr:unnamed protein product [Schistosoma mattheei]